MTQDKVGKTSTKSICFLIGLIGISLIGSVMSHPNRVAEASKMTYDKFLEQLNEEEPLDAFQMGKLSAQTVDNEKSNVIRNKFSVEQLLGMVIFNKRDGYTGDEFQNYLTDLEKDYSGLLIFMNPIAKWKIQKFSEQVASSLSNDESIDPVSAIGALLDRMNSSDKKNLVSDCESLVKKLAQSKKYAHTGTDYPTGFEEGWLMKKRYCKQVLLLSNMV